ncbi:MAG TPA: hypothetical protein VLR88_05760 [Propionibacteriaceae bacterium]|nr:hypothetical protein [Propionibacteriaceae bacterium]
MNDFYSAQTMYNRQLEQRDIENERIRQIRERSGSPEPQDNWSLARLWSGFHTWVDHLKPAEPMQPVGLLH